MLAALFPLLIAGLFGASSSALRFDQSLFGYNLNQNQTAVNPLDYFGKWQNHDFHPSPSNWRFPFYTLFLDKFVNGDPANDDINGTLFEHDVWQTQLRHGGDIQGLIDSLDYIQGMGMKGIYIAGSPFINQPWGADSYSPLDLTLLDLHYGNIKTWRAMVDEVHTRGMYVILDHTMSTMANLLGTTLFLNSSTPFSLQEYEVEYRDPQRQYLDFKFGTKRNDSCQYPRFWLDDGFQVGKDVTDQFKGCLESEFDQYGDIEAFGVHPDWQRQLSKFASVQDRLREWNPDVRAKIELFSCLTIMMLDIDGFRLDKATQITVDALGDFSHSVRQCARKVGKENFFIAGEIAGGNVFGSIYVGRGRQPDQKTQTLVDAVTTTNKNRSSVIRDKDNNALDAAAFHYSIYRALTRFLGMDGNLAAGFDTPLDFVDAWNEIILSNDLVNPNTNEFDPRHMFGVTNQDVFRWPAIKQGTERMLLGQFITTLHMPGIPLLLWGEEQAFYTLDNTAANYLFGRQAMSSAPAWEMHSCYKVGSTQYIGFPLDKAARGCEDPWNALDHRDPAAPVRNILKSMYQMRRNYASLSDGYFLQKLSNQTHDEFLPGSNGTATTLGMWSTMRGHFAPIQDLTAGGDRLGNQSVWLLYQNENKTVTYQFDCTNNDTALISPFDQKSTIKNLFFPHDEIVLGKGPKKLGIYGSEDFNGCLSSLTMKPFEFRAYVPKENFTAIDPMVTKFVPGHDARVISTVKEGETETVPIEFQFSAVMECDGLADAITISSSTQQNNRPPTIDKSSIVCGPLQPDQDSLFVGGVPSTWTFKAKLTGVANGVHELVLKNITTKDGTAQTGTTDRFFFRIGQNDNPVVFPLTASYSKGLFHQASDGSLFIAHNAPGADMFRYSLNFGSSFSAWEPYNGGNSTLAPQKWSGTSRQKWDGQHVIMQYHSAITGSSDHIQHADLDPNQAPRRFPHLFLEGTFNQFGIDSGLPNTFKQTENGSWAFNLMAEWPTGVQINEWGINPDGQLDRTGIFGDVDGDFVLDRLPPDSLTPSMINITNIPPSPHLAWKVIVNDATLRYEVQPVGNRWYQIIMFAVMWAVPFTTAALAIWVYMLAFYKVKFNKIGVSASKGLKPLALWNRFGKSKEYASVAGAEDDDERPGRSLFRQSIAPSIAPSIALVESERRTVLIATMEYDIEDWQIKIKIGGLGVMAQLMGKNLSHQNLIWVVPCVGGIDYPKEPENEAEPMEVTILGKPYLVNVQYHQLRNITYVLLDAPVFRAQSKSDPYPPRMDDLDSAIYYSAWNQCIAKTIQRHPEIDLYHINDYHGALAPLYLLPDTIPCCLSLHNAEFQGLWPMRTEKEKEEVCHVYNLDQETVQKYVQFGDVFNLLHAGSSYLRVHQKGFGAVGVSKKYGKRSWARYPIFWGLHDIGNLPNPDPSDTGALEDPETTSGKITVDPAFEAGRAELKRQAQEWAHLEQNPKAELLVFVGRWSMQKGVDLIADVMPAVLTENENVQLICVGPVIDLYGKFAALKLETIMKQFPGRVYSKPEFTALPPYIFSGAEFALIPSRDEPFGLVAVEFGRKGALGIGARVGGLGQMPGWWYTVESTSTSHLTHQFKTAIKEALSADLKTRQMMRARSAKQRFPVAQWVKDLETLQTKSIKIHQKESRDGRGRSPSRGRRLSAAPSGERRYSRPYSEHSPYRDSTATLRMRAVSTASMADIVPEMRGPSPFRREAGGVNRTLSLGMRTGPGQTAQSPDPEAIWERRDSGMSAHAHPDEYFMNPEQLEAAEAADRGRERGRGRSRSAARLSEQWPLDAPTGGDTPPAPSSAAFNARDSTYTYRDSTYSTPENSRPGSPRAGAETSLLPPPPLFSLNNDSNLSLDLVVGEKKDYTLQKVDPNFTDADGAYYNAFEQKLAALTPGNSEKLMSIEEYLIKSEKEWFNKFRAAKLGRSPSPDPSAHRRSWRQSMISRHDSTPSIAGSEKGSFQSLLGDNYKRPSFLKRVAQMRIGDWPIYSLVLALGQIIAATSYQIGLLSGNITQDETRFYVIGGIYLATSVMWYVCFRVLRSTYVLSLPFAFYGLAFLCLAVAPLVHAHGGKAWILNVGTGAYATASSSGSLYFALNFGDEGGSPIKSWVFRCCVIQGTQQIYVCALWFWGDFLTKSLTRGHEVNLQTTTITIIMAPIAFILFLLGLFMFFGLPDYYRQDPGKVPHFYASIWRRKIVVWFFIAVVLQNAFLSTQYGRNWQYLFSSVHAKTWEIVLLIFLFFIVIWAVVLAVFGRLSMSHSWILPIFAIGLGAPRWAQTLWSCSNIGLFIPWVGSPLASALVGRSLWLWLGVLDALQGVGFGMILLQTLTRIHISFTLITSQVIGTITLLVAHAIHTAPAPVFPDFSIGALPGLASPWFWIGLAAQLGVCVGFFLFFRKEQLSKP